MGGGISTNHNKVVEKYLPALEVETTKPLDASDVKDFEECKKELIDLRAKIRSMMDESKSFVKNEETLLRDSITELLQNAVEVEKSITPFLVSVAEKCKGRLAGLNFRFKARESLERKIRGDIECKKRSLSRGSATEVAVDIPSIVHSMGDALRYTMLIPDEEYCATVLNTRKVLEEMGNPAVKFKNYWEKGDMYQGINDNYRNLSTNFVFELQFHTQASWDLKAQSHIIYEKFRVCKDPMEQHKLFEEGVKLALTLNVPTGVENIPKLVRNPEPNILSAYGQVIHENGKQSMDFLKSWFVEVCGAVPIVTVDVDDERTIEAELSALVDSKNKSVEQIVQQDYFYGIMVKIVVDSIEYVALVKKIIEALKIPAADTSKNMQCCHVVNNWVGGHGAKCVRLLTCLGSKATPYPADNILFEVVIHTPESSKADEDATMLMRRESNKLTEIELSEKMNILWTSCTKPKKIEDISSTAST
jgi:hypothetical protein